MGWFGDGVVGEEEGVGGVKVHLFVWCSCFGLVVTAHSRYVANDNRTRSDTSSDSLIRFDLRSRRVMHGGGGDAADAGACDRRCVGAVVTQTCFNKNVCDGSSTYETETSKFDSIRLSSIRRPRHR